jgi:hypothetical protein
MPVIYTNTQDEWKRRRIDVRHINPSIMEGERGHTSMLGQGSAVPIVRYAPTFLFPPYLTGDFKIPSVLTANPGVIDASPKANIFYQWYVDGVMLIGETSKTLTTSLSFDDVEITCEVTAVNLLGVDVGLTNGITPGLVEPIINEEYFTYAVSGLSQDLKQNMFDHKTLITTGISMYLRTDVQQQIILIPTGMWVELRDDVMSGTGAVITGLGGDEGGQLYHNEAYVMWQPTRLADLPLINPSADLGDLTGWTVTEGSIAALTISSFGDVTAYSGTHFFGDQEPIQPSSSSMFQTVALNASDIVEAVDGTLMCNHMFMMENRLGQDGVQVTVQYLSSADAVLGTTTEGLLINTQNQSWSHQFSELEYVPSGTEKIKVIIFFNNLGTTVGYASIDDISVRLYSDT